MSNLLNREAPSWRSTVVEMTRSTSGDSTTERDAHAFAAWVQPHLPAMGRFPSRLQRRAVDLYYLVGLDAATTAQVMGCAPGTVKATLSQARRRLREFLGDDDD
jgi:hypothetical protein